MSKPGSGTATVIKYTTTRPNRTDDSKVRVYPESTLVPKMAEDSMRYVIYIYKYYFLYVVFQ